MDFVQNLARNVSTWRTVNTEENVRDKKVEKLELVKHQDDEDEEEVEIEQVTPAPPQPPSFWTNVTTAFTNARTSVETRLGVATPAQQELHTQNDQVKIEVVQQQDESYLSTLSGWARERYTSAKVTLGIEPETPPPPGLFLFCFFPSNYTLPSDYTFPSIATCTEAIVRKFNDFFALSTQHRIYGFFICAAIGIFCIAVSLILLPYILVPYVILLFALLFTTGSICLFARYEFINNMLNEFLYSSFFIVGPMKQLKMMFTTERIIPSLLYIISLFLTLFVVVAVCFHQVL